MQEDGSDKVKKGKTFTSQKDAGNTLTVFGLKTNKKKTPHLSIDYETLMMQKEEIQRKYNTCIKMHWYQCTSFILLYC